jgi:ribosomal protein S27AE
MSEDRKNCSKCGLLKPIEAFAIKRQKARKVEYRRRSCRECDRVSFLAAHKDWRDRNRDYVRGKSRENMAKWRNNLPSSRLQALNDRQAKSAVDRRERVKAAVYLAYGGAKCACCGEDEPLFLSIDHVNNDGYTLRKQGQPTGEGFYRRILREGCPPSYQVLCMNCNHGKARNGGICPHEAEKVQRLERKLVGSSDPKPPALFCEEMMI